MGLLASMLFSIPTAVFLWLWVNQQLAIYVHWDAFLSSAVLWYTILGFMAFALLFPNIFPSIMGGIWRFILGIQKWWGW